MVVSVMFRTVVLLSVSAALVVAPAASTSGQTPTLHDTKAWLAVHMTQYIEYEYQGKRHTRLFEAQFPKGNTLVLHDDRQRIEVDLSDLDPETVGLEAVGTVWMVKVDTPKGKALVKMCKEEDCEEYDTTTGIRFMSPDRDTASRVARALAHAVRLAVDQANPN